MLTRKILAIVAIPFLQVGMMLGSVWCARQNDYLVSIYLCKNDPARVAAVLKSAYGW